jgi:hypothetical protein
VPTAETLCAVLSSALGPRGMTAGGCRDVPLRIAEP